MRLHAWVMMAAVVLAGCAAPRGAGPVGVTIDGSKMEAAGMLINQTAPMAARVSAADGAEVRGVRVRWTATHGYFLDPVGAAVVYGATDFSDVDGSFVLFATASAEGGAIVRSVFPPGAAEGAEAPAEIPAVREAGAGSPEQVKAEQASYDLVWKGKLYTETVERAFVHEMYGVEHGADRDTRAAHVRAALALRPGDPTNIILMLRLAVLVGQNDDPAHHQWADPKAGAAVAEEIVARFDHKAYYREMADGACEAPEMIVPRAAIWASSYWSAEGGDRAKARKYAEVAMGDIQWTFLKRRAAWADAPRPSTRPSAFERRPGDAETRVRQWEKQKADAAAGDVLGPYAGVLCDAAVGVYVKACAAGPGGAGAALRRVKEMYAGSPLAWAAERYEKQPRRGE